MTPHLPERAIETGTEKPLFIPLRTEWFRMFETGEKRTEYRAYGPRWNERTCRVGRLATVSHGYSGKRLHHRVSGFEKIARQHAPIEAQTIYPSAEFISAISFQAANGGDDAGK
ncbi:MAG: hypothetical protein J0G95_11030 [Rhizobiales bacterium]|nr:hypothetical protein [Hyphomicrobiales bacterium]